jgi:hypothetical protein
MEAGFRCEYSFAWTYKKPRMFRFPVAVMKYLTGVLSAVTAIILACLMPGANSAFRAIAKEKATGMAALAEGVSESLLSPLFWIWAAAFFVLLLAASRLHNRVLRALLFWTPTLIVVTSTAAIATLVAYLYFHVRHG